MSFEEFIRSAGPPFCQFQKRINDDVMAVGMEGGHIEDRVGAFYEDPSPSTGLQIDTPAEVKN